MEPPPVRYTTTSDGYSIAYAVAGEGPPFVYMPGQFSSVTRQWSQDSFEPWIRGITERFTLVQYDGRGQGFSSRDIRDDQTIESLGRDLEAIVDALDLAGFVLLARWYACHIAVRYALAHPSRVRALVLIACAVDNSAWPTSLYRTLPEQNWEVFLLSQFGNIPLEEAQRRIETINLETTRADLAARARAYASSSVADALPRLRVPTLVLYPRDYRLIPLAESIRVASLITNARFAIHEGEMVPGDAFTGIRAIDAFLAEVDASARAPSANGVTPASLSRREVEVLRFVAQGLSNSQIAETLVLSTRTVERHIHNLYAKIGVRSRAQATAYAIHQKLT